MTQVHAMGDKMHNCMSPIREELETQISDWCVGQAELEDSLSSLCTAMGDFLLRLI
jgi:hypothetical protein